jgi:hypothetical protein
MKSIFSIRLIILIGLLLGCFSYAIVVWGSYSKLINTIKEAPFFEAFIANDPALNGLKPDVQTVEGDLYANDEIIWRLLLNAGIIPKDDRTDKLSCKIKEAFNSRSIDDDLFNKKGLDFVVEFASKIGTRHNESDSIKLSQTRSEIIDLIAYAMANYPGAQDNIKFKLDRDTIKFKGFSYFILPKGASLSKETPINEVLALIFSIYNINFPMLLAPEKPKQGTTLDANCQLAIEEYRQIKELLSFILISTKNDKEVVKARSLVVFFEGPMQWIMFVFFFIGLLILIVRVKIDDEVKEKKFQNTYRFIISTLPVLGFIGTILGLMLALRNADSIPLADGDLNTSIAISNITDTLSTAFTTTLLAFVLAIILSLINLILSYYSTKLLENDAE